MKNKKGVGLVVVFVAVALVFFFLGSSYGKGKAQVPGNNIQGGFGQNGGFVRSGANGTKGVRGGGMVNGTVVAKDAQSITVELRSLGNGQDNSQTGSKIVFYTDKTSVMKNITGSIADVAVGKNVNVIGSTNPDGSVNAETISLRPDIPLGQNQPKN